MARRTKQPFRLDLTPIVESMGMEWVIEQLGPKRVLEQLGSKRVLDELGAKRVLNELGGVKQLWAALTPEQRRQLKQLMQE
jgi:hypothetical protein